jgi:hypothetical protein
MSDVNAARGVPQRIIARGPMSKARAARSSGYDIEGRHEGLEVWLDISARDGQEELARTEAHSLHPGAARRLELGVRLAEDAGGIEGRLHVQSANSLGVDAIIVRDASLTIAAASAP